MRTDIIFRGKIFKEFADKFNNGEIKWVYGDLVHIKNSAIIIFNKEIKSHLPDNSNYALAYSIDEFAVVDLNTIGQYTGLTDLTNKPIYEGDIVEDISGDRYIVYYNYNLASFMILLTNTYSINEFPTIYHLDQLRNIKIIGNAYDNPELLYN